MAEIYRTVTYKKPTYTKSAEAARYESALERSLGRYKSMMDELKGMKAAAGAEIAPEFQEAVELYRPGGAYGAGAISRIREEQRKGVAGTLSQLVSSGMSSGALAAGVRAKYGREAQRGIQEVEDVRYERLGQALQAVALAREARGLRTTQAYQTAAGLTSAFQEPSVSQYSSPYELQQLRGEQTGQQTILGYNLGTYATRASQAFQTSEAEKNRQFQLKLASQKSVAQPTYRSTGSILGY